MIELNSYYFAFILVLNFPERYFIIISVVIVFMDLDFCHFPMISPLILFMYKISRETQNLSCIYTKYSTELELILKHISYYLCYHATYVNKWVPFNGCLQSEPVQVSASPSSTSVLLLPMKSHPAQDPILPQWSLSILLPL